MAVHNFQKTLGKERLSSVTDAIARQISFNFLFSAALGLKADLDNFKDPLTRNFLDVDSEVYLRGNTAHRLPKYVQAQNVLNQFNMSLASEQRKVYESIISYRSYFETIVPKPGHYYGYISKNKLLPLIVPGYHEDPVLDIQYRTMLRDYFRKWCSFPIE